MTDLSFEIVSPLRDIEIIASGRGVRERRSLIKQFGRGRWRKLKGKASLKDRYGNIRDAEIHWYEAHGIGRRKEKIKRYLE